MRTESRQRTRLPRQDIEIVPEFFLYGEPNQDVDVHFIHVETIAARSRLHDWNIAPHRHPALHHLMLVTRGGGELRADAAVHGLTAPTLVAVPPAIVHAFRFVPETDGWVVTMAEAYVAELCRQEGGDVLLPNLFEPTALRLDAAAVASHDLMSRFRAIEDEFRWHGLGRAAAISAHLRLLFVAVARLRQDGPCGARARSAEEGLYGRFRALVEAQFRKPRSIGAYARTLGTTEHALARACHRAIGRTPLAVVHGRRLIEAKRSLLYTSMTVAEIGYALGFRDPAYFSRFFTRRVGMPPNSFRGRHAATGAGDT